MPACPPRRTRRTLVALCLAVAAPLLLPAVSHAADLGSKIYGAGNLYAAGDVDCTAPITTPTGHQGAHCVDKGVLAAAGGHGQGHARSRLPLQALAQRLMDDQRLHRHLHHDLLVHDAAVRLLADRGGVRGRRGA